MSALDTLGPYELGETGKREAIPLLIRFLSVERPNDRRLASSAIGKLASKYPKECGAALPGLVELVTDPAPQVRQYALKAILKIGPRDADLATIESVVEDDEKEYNRQLAHKILDRGEDAETRVSETRDDPGSSADHGFKFGIGHLFTTGPAIHNDGIVHIAGVKYSTSEPPVRRDWILNPGRRITVRVVNRSQVTNPNVKGLPSWSDIGVREISPFFADLDVLFVFDSANEMSWFRDVIVSGGPNQPLIVNLGELAAFFLPDRQFFSAEQLMMETLPRSIWQKGSPRLPLYVKALEEVLQEIVRRILSSESDGKSHDLVYSLLGGCLADKNIDDAYTAAFQLAGKAHSLRWSDGLDWRRFEEPRVCDERTLIPARLGSELADSLPDADNREDDSIPETIRSVGAENIDGTFALLRKQSEGQLDERPRQIRYAHFIRRAINEAGAFAIEAGTGTGKTLGYLVPSCEFVRMNPGRQALIVTATKNLQDQVLRELSRLSTRQSLYSNVKGALLKGKTNYLCLTPLMDIYEENRKNGPSRDDDLPWIYLVMRLLHCGGDIEGIPKTLKTRFGRLSDYESEVDARYSCSADLCRFGPRCVYPRQVAKARATDVLVTNQHKLATIGDDVRERGYLCIVDEADKFPDNFRESVQDEITSWDLNRQVVNRLAGSERRRGFIQIVIERVEKSLGFEKDSTKQIDLDTLLSGLRSILEYCDQLRLEIENVRFIPNEKPMRPIRWNDLRPIGSDKAMQTAAETIAEVLGGIARDLEQALTSKRYDNLENDQSKGVKTKRREKLRMERYQDRVGTIAEMAKCLATEYPSRDYVHTVEKLPWGWSLCRKPMNIRPHLEKLVLGPFDSTVFTSATLRVQEAIDFFRRELCVDAFDHDEYVGSPFDYEKNVFGAVATFLPPFDHNDEANRTIWLSEVNRTLRKLIVATYGRTLVLFTSWKDLNASFGAVAPTLEQYDIEPIKQEESSLAEIHAFQTSEHSALFGVDRFWTGVDFPGATLSQVIVVRLPNPNLSDPLIKHRRSCFGNDPLFFRDFYNPLMRLKLKQGFGRLVRSKTDCGIFVMLDGRIATHDHFRRAASELPIRLVQYPIKFDPLGAADLEAMIEKGLKVAKLFSEFQSREIDLDEIDEID